MLEKLEHIIMLNDFYGPLLTEKQRTVLNLHYENDWSLAEIADNMNISRQAVFDLLRRAESALQEYEKRLHLAQRFLDTRQELEEVYRLLSHRDAVDPEKVARAADILKKLTDSV
ncbi:MAG: YlxM family DNA-binding protein [Syntrophomonas sp.]